MLPTRLFYGGSDLELYRGMQEYVSQNCPVLTIKLAAQYVKPWSTIVEILLWYRSRLGHSQLLAAVHNYQSLLKDLHFISSDDSAPSLDQLLNDECFSRVLNHTWGVLDAYYLELAGLIRSLMQKHPVIIQVPNLFCVDELSREVILRLVSSCHTKHGELLLGLPLLDKKVSLNQFKSWLMGGVQNKEQIACWLTSLDLASECRITDIRQGHKKVAKSANKKSLASEKIPTRVKHWAGCVIPAQLQPRNKLHSMWHWYRCYAFELVLDIGSHFDVNDYDELNQHQVGAVHALLSLSACMQGESEGELYLWLGLCIEHADKALKSLPVSSLRCYLLLTLWRLSQQYREEFFDSPEYGEILEADLKQLETPSVNYFHDWLTLYQSRAGLISVDNTRPTEKALFSELDAVPEAPCASSVAKMRDYQLSKTVMKVWQQEAGISDCQVTEEHELSDEYYCLAYEANYWMNFYQPKMNQLASLCWSSLLMKIGHQNCVAEYTFQGNQELALCYYRMGALTKANREFGDWRTRQDKWRSILDLRLSEEDMNVIWQPMLMAAVRVGSILTAWAILKYQKEVIANKNTSDMSYWFAYEGLLHAYAGDKLSAKESFKHSIAIADKCYSVSVYATISYIIGIAYERLGLNQKAIVLYENILKHGMAMAHARASDLFPIMVRLMVLADYNRDYTRYILNNLSLIMTDAESWWSLGDFLDLLRKHESDTNFSVFDVRQLTDLIWCASQRVDAQAATHQFCQRIPQHMMEQIFSQIQSRYRQMQAALPKDTLLPEVKQLLKKNMGLWNEPVLYRAAQ